VKKKLYQYNKHPPAKKGKKVKVRVTSNVTLDEEISKVYGMHGDLSTTCLRQCHCCRVACPQMNYSEAISIIDYIWNNWEKKDKAKILTTAIKYFFSKSLIKPCPMLSDNNCLVYERRPLSCRLYGLWPQDAYEKRVSVVSEALKMPKEQIPLNVQCSFVKRKNGSPLSIDEINGMYEALDKIDFHLLLKEDLTKQDEISQKIKKKWHYRTIHDWLLFVFLGEDWLVKLTSFSMASTKEALDDFIVVLERDVVPKLLEEKIHGGKR